MRKFIIKNRPKRKYTKKSIVTPTFSFVKTLYEILPLLIIIIAFTATLVISVPFRESLTKIRFTLQFPQFSLANPLIFFQTVFDDIIQMINEIGTLFSLMIASFYHTTLAVGNGTINEITFFNPIPFFTSIGNAIRWGENVLMKGIIFILSGVIFEYNTSLQIETVLISISISFIIHILDVVSSVTSFLAVFTEYLLTGIAQIIGTFINSLSQTILHILIVTERIISTVVIHSIKAVDYAFGIFLQTLLFIIKSILSFITYITTAVFTFFGNVIIAIVHVIEIPFKILYAFWLVIKPYMDIFLNHVKMTESDLSGGITDINNLITGFNSSK